MTRNPHEKSEPATSSLKLPLFHQIVEAMEIWKVVKEFSRKPTCGEEMGWPDWRQWF